MKKSFTPLIGASAGMQEVRAQIAAAAQSQAPVFITGESGTGKELVARAIHAQGLRAANPFEALNCAAIPFSLMESEIFGHAKGAFTGAVSSYIGAAERSDKGTLFLDELTEMPLDMQSKLLRFTQDGVFRPVGWTQEVEVDLRFICATNRPPDQALREGRLRADLYYRLNVISIAMPPLRDRRADIEPLAAHFVREFAREEGKAFAGIAPDALAVLQTAEWPGNVRQLQNTLRRAVVMHDGGILTAPMLKVEMAETAGQADAAPVPERVIPLRDVESRAIENALRLCRGNISEAARLLEINPSTIHRRRKGNNISKKDSA